MIRDLTTDKLDDFVAEVDFLGGPLSKDAIAAFPLINYKYRTVVNKELDPFSELYFDQQIRLHSELSGRSFNQTINELGPPYEDKAISAHNPNNNFNVSIMASHLHAISSTLIIANLPNSPNILDLGCGSGFTSEIMAYCGGSIDAIDINPNNVDLISSRAKRLGLNISAKVGEFDKLTVDKKYDLIFFYECLHHASKPWVLINTISKFLKPDGKIAFAGEPINTFWWPHWGLRLDLESIYMMRKYGWLELGWSESFITDCFTKAGLNLELLPGVGLNRGIIGIATSDSIKHENKPKPELIGASSEGGAQLLRNELHLKQLALDECWGHLNNINSSAWWKLGQKIDKSIKKIRGLK